MKRIILITAFIFSTNILFAQYYLIINNDDDTECIHVATGIEDVTIMDIDCGTATVLYSGKSYNTVLVGSRCWLKENLDVGNMINSTTGGTNSDGNQTNNSTLEKYCYNNDPVNCTTYGGLYQWNEAMQYVITEGVQGICPLGWHIPTYAELQYLIAEVSNDGNALKEIGQGSGAGAGTNTSGFSALLAGYTVTDGTFNSLGNSTFFWSSTEKRPPVGGSQAYNIWLPGHSGTIYLDTYHKLYGNSIRCIKD